MFTVLRLKRNVAVFHRLEHTAAFSIHLSCTALVIRTAIEKCHFLFDAHHCCVVLNPFRRCCIPLDAHDSRSPADANHCISPSEVQNSNFLSEAHYCRHLQPITICSLSPLEAHQFCSDANESRFLYQAHYTVVVNIRYTLVVV